MKPDEGRRALAAFLAGDSGELATAVRFLLEELGSTHEGAVQCIEGPRHTRGTPPNVVELSGEDWVALATGASNWDALLASGRINASGTRADLSAFLPLV